MLVVNIKSKGIQQDLSSMGRPGGDIGWVLKESLKFNVFGIHN